MESPEKNKAFETIELEPVDQSGFRADEGENVWTTVMGKNNQIAIGFPRCLLEEHITKEGLITPEDIREFSTEIHSFYNLNLALTLRPDEGCRFRSVDFVINIAAKEEIGNEQRLPLILRLRPAERTSPRKVITVDKTPGLVIADPLFNVFKLDLEGVRVKQSEVENISVSLESFGSRTRKAGWRFRITDGIERIPMDSPNLEALIVTKRKTKVNVQFLAIARIDVLSPLDKWLTLAFKMKNEPSATRSYEIPLQN